MRRPKVSTLADVLGKVILVLIMLSTTATVSVIAIKQYNNHKDTVQQGTEISNTNAILHFIADCTSPAGACYKEGQMQTAVNNSKIETIIVLAAACAKSPDNDTVPQITKCVQAGLSSK